MSPLKKTSPLPAVFSDDAALIAQTAQRLQVTMQQFGINIQYSGMAEQAYHELSSQLYPAMQQLLQSNRPVLMRVLYTVDISEQKLNAFAAKYPKAGMAAIIAHLILEREFQKVLTRKYFSG